MKHFNRIDIENRENLTMLAKAYLDRLLPRAVSGNIYYDHDDQGEIKYLYFESNYYLTLTDYIKNNKTNFLLSNAAGQWYQLFNVIENSVFLETIDYGIVDLYESLTDFSGTLIEPDYTFFEKRSSIPKELLTFYNDLKRIYAGISITYWGDKNYIGLNIYPDENNKITFDLKPIFELLNIYNYRVIKFDIIKASNSNELKLIFNMTVKE